MIWYNCLIWYHNNSVSSSADVAADVCCVPLTVPGSGQSETINQVSHCSIKYVIGICFIHVRRLKRTRFNQHNSDMNTSNENHTGTTLSVYVRRLKRDNIPYNIKWEIVKRAAPYNPITKMCRLCISEKQHILFHPEDATLNQRSEFFSKCWHKDKHLLANN